ncbi:MAG: hypothetical protein ACXVBE_05480 [Bdellovibrionota bacterium]
MKQLLFLFGLMASVSAQAADTTAKIHEKDWEANGAFNLSHFQGASQTNLEIQGGAQYFFLDGLSAGLDGQYYNYGHTKFGSVAPILTKYLWVKDKIAPYVSLVPIRFGFQSGGSTSYSSSIRPGVKFFLNDNIAVGPAIDYAHYWGPAGYQGYANMALLGLFSLHF